MGKENIAAHLKNACTTLCMENEQWVTFTFCFRHVPFPEDEFQNPKLGINV